jgi:acetyl-CoA acetyltransferase
MRSLRKVFVAGIAMNRWSLNSRRKWYDHGSEVAEKVLKDADMEWNEIQAAFCGSCYQGVGAGHQTIAEIGLTGIPIVNVENACSSGASAFRLAYQSVATELYDIVLALGAETNPRGPIPSTSFRPWQWALGMNHWPPNYAFDTVRYMEDYGATVEDFSLVAVKNRRNAALNPLATFQKEVTLEEVLNSRMVSTPIRLLHSTPLSDGAAAAILCSEDKLKSKSPMIRVDAAVLTTGVYGEVTKSGSMPGGSIKFPAAKGRVELSAEQAYEISGYGPEDIDVLQAYDTMAPSELWDIEKLGFCKRGEAPRLLREGVFDIGGRIPTNTDGGLLGRGHPMGATGLGQIHEVVLQLRAQAGPRQVEGARIGLCHAMGAGPNSAVTILRRV